MSHTDDLAARAAAAASAAAHELSHTETPHPTLDEVSDAMLGLPDEEHAASVLEHAEGCDECAAHVADFESVIELARFAYPDRMPSEIQRRLEAVLVAEAAVRTKGTGSTVDGRPALDTPTTPTELADQAD